ncbi:hypothetical protein BDV12DRAFT_200680 [Aspergillus spectabilis]
MSLDNFPTELLFAIGSQVQYEGDLLSLCKVNRRFNAIYQPLLFQHNIRYNRSSGLSWAAYFNSIDLARTFITHGADPNRRALKFGMMPDDQGTMRRHWNDKHMALETPILIAVRQGYKDMAVFLLKNGATRTSGLFYIASKTGWADMENEFRAIGVA